jgi:hypothetical protein
MALPAYGSGERLAGLVARTRGCLHINVTIGSRNEKWKLRVRDVDSSCPEAKSLRDALIELYPLPVKPAEPSEAFEAGDSRFATGQRELQFEASYRTVREERTSRSQSST